jgi:hypothetical protein
MKYDPDIPELGEDPTGEEVHDAVESVTNLSVSELREWEDSQLRSEYLEAANDGKEETDGPIPGGPLEDTITLLETPADEYTEDHIEEGEELVNFVDRTLTQFERSEGEDLMPDKHPGVHKGYAQNMNWGVDPFLGDNSP